MLQWIASNFWTIIICAVLLGIVTAIIVSMIKKRRSGKSVMCNCGNCPHAASCGSRTGTCHNSHHENA